MTHQRVDQEPRSDARRATEGLDAAPGARSGNRSVLSKVAFAVVAMGLVAVAGRVFLSFDDEGSGIDAVAQRATAPSQPAHAVAPPHRAAQPPNGAAAANAPSGSGTQAARPTPKTRKRAVVLGSDLAFGYESARVSGAARTTIERLARQARAAGLSGTVLVEGYTDNLGSAAYGRQLSQRRADAVARILRRQLRGTGLAVVARGRGESHPVRSNATAAGRAANRRVTIKLPSP